MDTGWEDAIKRGDVQVVRELLDRGTNVDSRDQHGQTALMLAAHAGHREVVEALIAHRANLNTTAKYGLSALMMALIAGHRSGTALGERWDRSLGAGNRCAGIRRQDSLRSCYRARHAGIVRGIEAQTIVGRRDDEIRR
jgi:hypothetical protein